MAQAIDHEEDKETEELYDNFLANSKKSSGELIKSISSTISGNNDEYSQSIKRLMHRIDLIENKSKLKSKIKHSNKCSSPQCKSIAPSNHPSCHVFICRSCRTHGANVLLQKTYVLLIKFKLFN